MNTKTELMIQSIDEMDLLEFSQRADVDMDKPIQELFDNCLNFISVCDFLEL